MEPPPPGAPYQFSFIGGLPYVVYPDGTTYSTVGGAVDANCTLEVCPLSQTIYGYRPSFPGSIVLIVLFGISIIIQLGLGIRYKTWGFMTVMILGALDEILGYVGRILYYQNPWSGSAFVMQIVTITIGPVFYCAAIYVMIYKVINYIDRSKARFNPRLIYWVFIGFDLVSLALQSAGGGLSSDSTGASHLGVPVALAGLSIQVATLAIFILICADYAFASRHTWKNRSLPLAFKLFVGFLSLAVITIFIRCCYRVEELGNGYSRQSKVLRDEGLFSGLESAMIMIATYAMIGAHPGFVFNKNNKSLSQGKEIEEAREKDIASNASSE